MNQHDLTTVLAAIAELQPNSWIPAFSALGGTIIGIVGTLIHTKYLEDRREKKFAEQVLKCIVAEVSALVRLIESRKYVESIENIIEYLKENPDETYTLSADIPGHYSRIYVEQCKNLGVLDQEVSKNIIHFYQLIDAVVQDIKIDGTFTTDPSLEGYEETLGIFKLAVRVGKSLEKR